MLIVIAEF